MECGKQFALPKDIPWKRLAYSFDMIDILMDRSLPPKWRSSVAVFYYDVPEEETIEDYPDRRIVFLKASATFTGFIYSGHEEPTGINHFPTSLVSYESGTSLATWMAVQHKNYECYFPCYGGILQISVFPHANDLEKLDLVTDVSEDAGQHYTHAEYEHPDVTPVLEKIPYIVDFEPKKREVFEAKAEGGESINTSSNTLNTGKSNTNTESISIAGELKGGAGNVGGGVSVGWEDVSQEITQTNKDWSREKRESFSHTTSMNQVYSIFDGYHLGTNRAMFVIQPRPHMVDSDFSLINGPRRLEGIQDVFLVVSIPKANEGFCVKASLDTGHLDERYGYIPTVKKLSDLSMEDYEKDADRIDLENRERDLYLEFLVSVYNELHVGTTNLYLEKEEGEDYDMIKYRGETLFSGSREECSDFMWKVIAEAYDLGAIINYEEGEESEVVSYEKFYVIYEKGIKRDESKDMFMTRRTVQNCALFNKETGMCAPGSIPAKAPSSLAHVHEPVIIYEADLVKYANMSLSPAIPRANTKEQIVHNYNMFSNTIRNSMVSSYASDSFKPSGVPFAETSMFRKNIIQKLTNMPSYHPANLRLSQIKKIDQHTLRKLQKLGIKRVKDLYTSRKTRFVKEEPFTYEMISDLKKMIFPEKIKKAKDNIEQQRSKNNG